MKKSLLTFLVIFLIAWLLLVFYKNGENKKNIDRYEELPNVEETIDPLAPTLEKGIYTNKYFGYRLNTPEPLRVTDFDEGSGHTTLVQGEIAGLKDFSMQIYISPFDEDVSLTIDRIRKDIPDMKLIEPIEIKTDGIATVAFFSNENGEKYRQIWFVRDSYLYQILTKASHDNITGKIMETWKWGE